VADDDKHWQDMSPDEQAVVIRQINGAVNGLQFRVQDLEDAVKALHRRSKLVDAPAVRREEEEEEWGDDRRLGQEPHHDLWPKPDGVVEFRTAKR
jgi:hypothetical protein